METTELITNTESLREWEKVFETPSIQALSAWREKNSDDIVDEEMFRSRAVEGLERFGEKLEQVFDNILTAKYKNG